MDYTRLPFDPVRPQWREVASQGASLLDQEFDKGMQSFRDLGYTMPQDITKASFLAGATWPFIPDQLPPAQRLPDVSPQTKQFFATVVHPNMGRALRQADARTLALGFQMGRIIGAAHEAKRVMNFNPPLKITDEEVTADGQRVPITTEMSNVLEYGMGVNGLFTHLNNVRSGAYSVTGIHKTKGEATVLDGVADYYGLSDDQMRILDRGVAYRAKGMLREQGEGSQDMVIASRVHEAGQELRVGIQIGAKLLKHEGIFIARGPRWYPKGIGYDTIRDLLKKTAGVAVRTDAEYTETAPNGQYEPNRLVIARRAV